MLKHQLDRQLDCAWTGAVCRRDLRRAWLGQRKAWILVKIDVIWNVVGLTPELSFEVFVDRERLVQAHIQQPVALRPGSGLRQQRLRREYRELKLQCLRGHAPALQQEPEVPDWIHLQQVD